MKLIVLFVAIYCFGDASTEGASAQAVVMNGTSILQEKEEITVLSITSDQEVLPSGSIIQTPTPAEADNLSISTNVDKTLLQLSSAIIESSFSTTPSNIESAQLSTEKVTTTAISATKPLLYLTSTPATTKNNVPTTSSPKILRSKSRQTKKLENKQRSDSTLIPLKVTRAESFEGKTQINSVRRKYPEEIAVNALHSESYPQMYRNQKILIPTSKNEEIMVAVDNAATPNRRGRVRYLTGKQLGRDAPPINFQSKYESDKFKFSYETKDGQSRYENGVFENIGAEDQNYIVKGSYSYFDDEGIEYTVNYTADNRGYRPVITVNNPNRA